MIRTKRIVVPKNMLVAGRGPGAVEDHGAENTNHDDPLDYLVVLMEKQLQLSAESTRMLRVFYRMFQFFCALCVVVFLLSFLSGFVGATF